MKANHNDVNNPCYLSLRRCRTVMEYPKRQSDTGLRWSQRTPLVTSDQYQDRILHISRLWTSVSYCPFPEAENPYYPQIPIVSEEQNGSLEFYEGIPVLHLKMWQRDPVNPSGFTNRAFNLCLGITVDEGQDEWDQCRIGPLNEQTHHFCAPEHHPLHRANRYSFFDVDRAGEPNNLPLLVVCGKGHDIVLKNPEELVTLIMSNSLQKRFPSVSSGLCGAVHFCIEMASVQAWRNNIREVLSDLLWSGNHDDTVKLLITEFNDWCVGNNFLYPAWAIESESLKSLPRAAFQAVVLNSVSVYQHDYGLEHLSSDPFVEEVRQLSCVPDTKEFIWERGHTQSFLLTSDWVRNQLQMPSETMEVKTLPRSSYSGERLNLPSLI